jgi:fructose-1,6-bisphosphatase/sedoheptulose 1,7-bisphosphatase-like protein
VANGLPNSISVIAASHVDDGEARAVRNRPSFYSRKLACGPAVVKAMREGMEPIALNDPLEKTLPKAAQALEN